MFYGSLTSAPIRTQLYGVYHGSPTPAPGRGVAMCGFRQHGLNALDEDGAGRSTPSSELSRCSLVTLSEDDFGLANECTSILCNHEARVFDELGLEGPAFSGNVYDVPDRHNIVPDLELVQAVTHVGLAFIKSATFLSLKPPEAWPLFTTVAEVRQKFPPSTRVIVSIGGWGDDVGWPVAAATDESRQLFARNIATMVRDTGADGVDIDWEYPGGHGEDYKRDPSRDRAWEVEAYPKLLAEIRAALGSSKIISAAVPGLRRDMMAFTKQTIPAIMQSLDFLNVMTYDLMNRRDNVTKHHTGIEASLDSIGAYLDMGVKPEKLNLGFAFYVKWFETDPQSDCKEHPVGCKTVLMEDPDTGADTGRSGAFSWHDSVPEELSSSFSKALKHGAYDDKGGGHFYWDEAENKFWTWDTPDVIAKKIPEIIKTESLGGAFAWALGEDANEFSHLKALNTALQDPMPVKKEL